MAKYVKRGLLGLAVGIVVLIYGLVTRDDINVGVALGVLGGFVFLGLIGFSVVPEPRRRRERGD